MGGRSPHARGFFVRYEIQLGTAQVKGLTK